MHTQTGKKLRIDLSRQALTSMIQAKTHCLPMVFQKNPDTPTKTRRSRAQFQKGQPIPYKTRYAFPHSPPR